MKVGENISLPSYYDDPTVANPLRRPAIEPTIRLDLTLAEARAIAASSRMTLRYQTGGVNVRVSLPGVVQRIEAELARLAEAPSGITGA